MWSTLILRSWPVLLRSWQVLFRSWQVLFRSWQVLFRSWQVFFRSWQVLLRSWQVLLCSWQVLFCHMFHAWKTLLMKKRPNKIIMKALIGWIWGWTKKFFIWKLLAHYDFHGQTCWFDIRHPTLPCKIPSESMKKSLAVFLDDIIQTNFSTIFWCIMWLKLPWYIWWIKERNYIFHGMYSTLN